MDLGKKLLELEDLFIQEHEGHIYKLLIEALEKPLIEKVLEKTKRNQLQAARILGINRNTLRSKMKKLGIWKR